ncbi:MAG: N4-gp56 family major capsid protein [Kiritimatiellae bacterium]|nr:N4-gp56 family major capsid protein [Kiritimatiellia bacterium]
MLKPVNTYGSISPRTQALAAAKLLAIGQPAMNTQRFAQIDYQPQRSTKVRKWRRYNPFGGRTTTLVEGVAPAPVEISYTDITVTLEQLGIVVPITDVIQDTHEDPILNTVIQRVSEDIAETIESRTFDVLKSGTNVFYANGAAGRAYVNSGPTVGDFRRIVRALQRADAKPFTTIIAPTASESTTGIEAAYFALCHTDMEGELRRSLSGFKTIVEYANPGEALPNEIGAFERIRFVTSRLYEPWYAAGASGTTFLSNGEAPATSAPCDVYPIVVVARDSYAVVRLQGYDAVKVSVVNPNEVNQANPVGQIGFVSAKTWFAAARLNERWLATLEAAVAANPAA